jgi:hypothetical protein
MKALLLLLRMNAFATIRRLVAGIRTPKGALVSLFMLGFAMLILVPNAAMFFNRDGPPPSLAFIEYAPLALFAYMILTLLTSAGEKAIAFSPSEVDFLFTAPFSRRELLVYKIVGTVITSVAMGHFMAAACAFHFFHHFFFAAAGLSMTLLFIPLAGMLITLIGQVVAEHAFSRGRQLLALVLLALFGLAILEAMKGVDIAGLDDLSSWAREISGSTMGRVVLAPFAPFCNAMAAENASSFMIWISCAMLINGVMIGGILLTDANYLETAARVSQRVYEAKQRIRRSGGAPSLVTSKSVRWRLPMFARMRGFGPMAWRQLTCVLRQSKGILIVMGIVAACFVLPNLGDISGQIGQSPTIVAILLGAVSYISLLFSIQSPFGFRADIDHIEVFKALPIDPFPIAAGQLVGSVILFTSLHWSVSIVGIAITGQWYGLWLAAMAIAVPLNLLMFSIANGLFLLFPLRGGAGGQNVQAIGQSMLFMTCQIFAVLGAVLISGIPAGVAYALTGSFTLAALLALIVLSSTSVAGVFFTAWAFERFDVSQKPA